MSTSPVQVGEIPLSNNFWFRGQTRTLAARGDWLYVSNDRDPHLLAVNINDDVIDGGGQPGLTTEIVGISIPDLAGAIASSTGLALHPDGTKLYFTNFLDTFVRVFTINPTDGTDLDQVSTIPIPDAIADNRTLVVTPDGRYLGVANRTAGTTDVFDLQNPFGPCGTPPCQVASVATGSSSNNLQSTSNSQYLFVPSSGRNAVTIIDLRNGESTQYQAVTASGAGSGAGTIALTPGLETPTGSDVTVAPVENVEIVYDSVLVAGETTVTSSNVSEIDLPSDFVIAGNSTAIYYDVTTTAVFDGSVSICFNYGDGLTQEEEESLRLLHEEECTQALVDAGNCLAGQLGTTVYVDRTDESIVPNPDTSTNTICGVVDSFSLFVVVRQALRAQVRERINLKSNGVVQVEVLSSPSFDAATLNPATVTFAGVSVKQKKKGSAVSFEDVNSDGLSDAVFQFDVSGLNLSPGDTEAEFVGTTFGGIVKRTTVPVTVR